MLGIILAFTILFGFVLGYFFTFPVLLTVTVVCAAIGAWLWNTLEELTGLIAFIFVVLAVIGNVVMWVTFYFVSHQTFVSDFFRTYILR